MDRRGVPKCLECWDWGIGLGKRIGRLSFVNDGVERMLWKLLILGARHDTE